MIYMRILYKDIDYFGTEGRWFRLPDFVPELSMTPIQRLDTLFHREIAKIKYRDGSFHVKTSD